MKDRFGFDWSKIQGAPYWKKPMLGRRMFFRHVASAVGGYFLLPTRPMETIAKAVESLSEVLGTEDSHDTTVSG